MIRLSCAAITLATIPGRCRCLIGGGLSVLAVSIQCAVLPLNLEQLLQLPLDRLLELKVAGASVPAQHDGTAAAPRFRVGAEASR